MVNLILIFGIPLLALFLSRKRSVHAMTLWTILAEVFVIVIYVVVRPIAYHLSWGTPAEEAISLDTIAGFLHGDGSIGLAILAASVVLTGVALLLTINARKQGSEEESK